MLYRMFLYVLRWFNSTLCPKCGYDGTVVSYSIMTQDFAYCCNRCRNVSWRSK